MAARARVREWVVHTTAWAFFAFAILIIPVAAWRGDWRATLILIGVVSECIVVAANGMRCPPTPLAARYTTDRSDNFDLYPPLWLARYNKGSSAPCSWRGSFSRPLRIL